MTRERTKLTRTAAGRDHKDTAGMTFKPLKSPRMPVVRMQTNLSESPHRIGSDAEDNENAAAQLLKEESQHQRRTRSEHQSKAKSQEEFVKGQKLFEDTFRAGRITSPVPPSKVPQPPAVFQQPPTLSFNGPPFKPESFSGNKHTTSKIPKVNLTPQERKDEELDLEVMNRLNGVRELTMIFCQRHFGIGFTMKGAITAFMKAVPWELITYVGCVADGGPDGEKGWMELLTAEDYRVALVFGIIQRAIKEHVFGSLMFGAPDELLKILTDTEKQQEDHDGFTRTETRAQIITSYELGPQGRVTANRSYGMAIMRLTLQLEKLLEPISEADPSYDPERGLYADLVPIITAAADLSTLMRRNGDTVLYHFQPVFKDLEFNTEDMDLINLQQLKQEIHLAPEEDNCLVKVVGSFELVAYRKGGGVMAERILEKEENEIDYSVAPELRHRPRNEYRGRLITAKDGYRTKLLAKAMVAGRFGQPRFMAPGSEEDTYGNKHVDLLNIVDQDPEKRCGVM